MQDHFLRELNIIDYKCFKNFNTQNLKRINLISGKNNIGKTTFLESLYFNLYSEKFSTMYNSLINIKYMRENLNFLGKKLTIEDIHKFLSSIQKIHISSNIRECSFLIKNDEIKKEYSTKIDEKEFAINVKEFNFDIDRLEKIQFIDNFGFTKNDLIRAYIYIQKKEKEIYLDKLINEFDPMINKFKLLGAEEPSIKTSYSDDYLDIDELGDGFKHYISIICALYASENGQLFIDEIDNGIHYSQLEKLWEVIFTISKEVNCQVFATTHSKEMINAFAKASKKLNDDDISFIELGRNKNNEIKSITMNYERFHREMISGNEIRGW